MDVNNPLLSGTPCRLDGGVAQTADGRVGVLTVRTTSATVTGFLSAEELRTWAKFINDLANEVDGGSRIAPVNSLDAAAINSELSKLSKLSRG